MINDFSPPASWYDLPEYLCDKNEEEYDEDFHRLEDLYIDNLHAALYAVPKINDIF